MGAVANLDETKTDFLVFPSSAASILHSSLTPPPRMKIGNAVGIVRSLNSPLTDSHYRTLLYVTARASARLNVSESIGRARKYILCSSLIQSISILRVYVCLSVCLSVRVWCPHLWTYKINHDYHRGKEGLHRRNSHTFSHFQRNQSINAFISA